jgi:hypothetical protein
MTYAIQVKSAKSGRWIPMRLGSARGHCVYMDMYQYRYMLAVQHCIDGVHYRAVPVS